MNIGIFTDTYKPNINGVVTSIAIKKEQLEKIGHKVYIIAPYEPGYEDTDSDIMRLKSFKLIFQPEYRLSYLPDSKVMKKIRALELDIIHSETPFSIGLIAKYVAKKEKLPLLHTYHTLFPEYVHYLGLPTGITRKMAEKASAIYCNMCDHIIAPSYEVKRELLRYGVKKDMTIIPTGVSVNSFLDNFDENDIENIKIKYGINKTEKILLFVGRLGKEKNIDFLIEVFSNLIKSGEKNIKMLLVGDGPYRETLEKKVEELNIKDKTIFAGYVDRTKIGVFYKAADIFIFSSLTETQGLVVLEAMAAEKPVVAIKASGVEDMIINDVTGFLTENSIFDFLEKLKILLSNDELYEKFSKNGRERAEDFNPTKVTEKMNNIYINLNENKIKLRLRKALKFKRKSEFFLKGFKRRKEDKHNKLFKGLHKKK